MTSVSPATATRRGPDTLGFRSSGSSPGVTTVHLVGPGQVGRRFLGLLPGRPFRLLAVSDSKATAYDRGGLDPAAIAAHKAAGRSLAELPGAEVVNTSTAIAVCGADVVVDATPSGEAGTAAALARARTALAAGAFLALCGKNALAAAAGQWLPGPQGARVGINAALGGAGLQLRRELQELRARCDELVLCGNVTSTVIVQAIEAGASVAEGVEHARQLGLLEPDPTLDLDGRDAAVKLLAVWGAVFGDQRAAPPALHQVRREDVRGLDVELVRARARRGATTRLLGCAGRNGDDLRVTFVELDAASPLAAPPDRVVYAYRLGSELRVHTGLGVGYQGTAEALLADLLAREAAR